MDNLYSCTSISLPYKIEYINVVSTFLKEVGDAYGANSTERMQLRLLGEEVFLFILKGVPKYEFDEQFTLTCTADDDGLLMSFSNHGEPLCGREISDNALFSPEEDIENLGLEIVKGICDWCEYVNRGADGWSIVVSKHIQSFKDVKRQNDEELERLTKEAATEKLTIKRADSSYAKSIISLMYMTYRYSYAKSLFYYEEKLAEAIDNGKVISIIAVNDKDEVVGHNAALFDSESLAEVGMAMVNPIYRLNRTFLLLIKRCKAIFMGDELDYVTYYNKCVTTHIMSQRSASLTGFIPSALKLSTYPRASFIGINNHDKKRESLVYATMPSKDSDIVHSIYIPCEHRELCQEMLAKLNFNYSFAEDISSREECEDIDVSTITRNNYTEISVKGVGNDLFARLREIDIEAIRNGSQTVSCSISTAEPLPEDFDKRMGELGYFFCGLKPSDGGEWTMLYSNLLYQRFDFDDVNLHDPFAVKIREYCRGLYTNIKL